MKCYQFGEVFFFEKFGQSYEIYSILWNFVKIVKLCQNCEILSKLWNSIRILKFYKFFEICQNFVEIMVSEHCVRHYMLIMVCGIVFGKAKTTKVGMVWYELNIVNQSINQSVTKVGIELLGQLKIRMTISWDPWVVP